MFKKFLVAAAMAAAIFTPFTATPAAAAETGVTMEAYANVRGSGYLSKLSMVDIADAKRTAPELKEIGDWYRRAAFYLGQKEYALSTGWTPQTIQLVTPYSLTKYLYYVAGEKLEAPDQALLDEIAAKKDIVWVWVWNNGTYSFRTSEAPIPTIENVVIRTNEGEMCKFLVKEGNIPENAMKAANINTAQLWPFPAKLFSGVNIPMEIILLDSQGNKKPLKLGQEDLRKCK